MMNGRSAHLTRNFADGNLRAMGLHQRRLGAVIRAARERKGWTQRYAARRARIHTSVWCRVEAGITGLTTETADRVARALETTIVLGRKAS